MINKDLLGQIILDWQKFEIPPLTKRDLEISLEQPLRRATVLMGPRRSGKTYYFYDLINRLENEGVKRKNILYINFENPKLLNLNLEDLSTILEVYESIFPDAFKEKTFLFFDEIQNIDNWEVFIRSILDHNNFKVFLTGSSSKMLSSEIATSLRGRTLTYLMLPFSFKEFLKFKKIKIKKYFSSKEKAKISNYFLEYFNFGAYPENLIYPQERQRITTEIIQTTIFRDLIERHGIRNIKAVKIMFNYLVKSKQFSVNKFYHFLKSINLSISKNVLYNYLDFYLDAFVFFALEKFSLSLKKSEQSFKKIYCLDNSFIAEIVGDDKGSKLENIVFLELLHRGLRVNKDFFYFLENYEVDFIILKKNKVSKLIQVCFDLNNFETKNREARSLLKASNKLDCDELIVITFDYKNEEKIDNKLIKFIPVLDFVLEFA